MQIFDFIRINGILEIKAPYNAAFIKFVKTISGREWDPTKKVWRIPDNDKIFEMLINEIKKLGGICNISNATTPCVKNSDINKNFNLPQVIPIVDDDAGLKSETKEKDVAGWGRWLENFGREMRLLKYSQKTIKTYCGYVTGLINHSMKSPELITSEDLATFMEHLVDKRAFSASSLNIAINAFKLFFKSINHDNLDYNIKRPRKDKKLPVILAVNEVAAILDSTTNYKHRLLLMAAYSAGLRVSEVVSLKISDIDFERNLITIRAGKGRKDRVTLLSNAFRKSLDEYEKFEKISEWLFSGHSAGTHLSVRTAEKVFENALKKSGIKKHATIHTLRHSFATHLLESGIDIRYIQKLLGHANVKTTEIYTHVSAKHLISIKSPLDKIFKE